MLDYTTFSAKVKGTLSTFGADSGNEISLIKDFVEDYRIENGVFPQPGRKFEASGIAHGEDNLLLYQQLVTTPYGTDAWSELSNNKVRKMVLERIAQDIKWKISPTKH